MTPELSELKNRLQKNKTLNLKIKVTPKSGKHEMSAIMSDGTVKIKLKSAPEQGKANQELIELLSNFFEVAEKNISISHGETSARKTVKIEPKT